MNEKLFIILKNKEKSPFLFKTVFILFFMLSYIVVGQGTRTVSPDEINNTALFISGSYGSYKDCPEQNRLKFEISDKDTQVFNFGFNAQMQGVIDANGNYGTVSLYYRIYNNTTGDLVVPATKWKKKGVGSGYIETYDQAVNGPNRNGVVNGYDPITFTPTENGTYYIEYYPSSDLGLTYDTKYRLTIGYWDFSVVNKNTGSYVEGMVHCENWGFYVTSILDPLTNLFGAYRADGTIAATQATFYAYTAEKTINTVVFPDLVPVAFTVALNSYGVDPKKTFEESRKSIEVSSGAPALTNCFKLFLETPNSDLFPVSPMPAAPKFDSPAISCEAPLTLNYITFEDGDVRFILDLDDEFGYQAEGKDRLIEVFEVSAGKNSYTWDGEDGLGNIVPPGTQINMDLTFLKGRFNLPLNDAEINVGGIRVDIVAPLPDGQTEPIKAKLYWDDSLLEVGANPNANDNYNLPDENGVAQTQEVTVLNGATSPNHKWVGSFDGSLGSSYGNLRVINTWGWGSAISGTGLSVSIGCADLKVEKTIIDEKPMYAENDEIKFSVVLTNDGTVPAVNSEVKDLLPAGYKYISDTATQGSYDDLTGLWSVGDLNVGASVKLIITAKLTTVLNYENIAIASSDMRELDPSNNISSATPVIDINGDEVEDNTDLDDDNDGILDTLESFSCGFDAANLAFDDRDYNFESSIHNAYYTVGGGGEEKMGGLGVHIKDSPYEVENAFNVGKITKRIGPDGTEIKVLSAWWSNPLLISKASNPKSRIAANYPYRHNLNFDEKGEYRKFVIEYDFILDAENTEKSNDLIGTLKPQDGVTGLILTDFDEYGTFISNEVDGTSYTLSGTYNAFETNRGQLYNHSSTGRDISGTEMIREYDVWYNFKTEYMLISETELKIVNTKQKYDASGVLTGTPQVTESTVTVDLTGEHAWLKDDFEAGIIADNDFTNVKMYWQECDYDNDGIPNRLDLDSDNDGCPDTLEANDKLTPDQLNEDGSIKETVDKDGDGVIDGYQVSGLGTSQNKATIKITTPIENQKGCEKDTVTFSLTPEVIGDENWKYEWSYLAKNADATVVANWTNVESDKVVTSTEQVKLDVTNLTKEMNGRTYRVKFTNSKNPCDHEFTAILNVNDITKGAILEDKTVVSGESLNITSTNAATSTNGTISYKWEKSTDNGNTWTVIDGETGVTYNTDDLIVATKFKRVEISTLTIDKVEQICEEENIITVTIEERAPKLELKKVSSSTGELKVGSIITYTFTVKNTGNVTIEGVKVEDKLLGLTALILKNGGTGDPSSLLPEKTVIYEATYTLTQADLDVGVLKNTATVIGKDPKGKDVTDISDSGNEGDNDNGGSDVNDKGNDGDETNDPTVTTIPNKAGVELTKSSSSLTAESKVGSKITYTFTVKNTGDVTLKDLVVIDSKIDGVITLTPTTLLPGATVTGTTKYTLTQADFDAGKVENTASVTGKDPKGKDITDVSDSGNEGDEDKGDDGKDDGDGDGTDGDITNDPTVTPVPNKGGVVLTKSSSSLTAESKVGDDITYSFEVENTGDVTLKDLVVTDSKIKGEITLSSTTLLPGIKTTGTGIYTLTQSDFEAGKVENSATVTGKDPKDGVVTDISDSGNEGDEDKGDDGKDDGDGDGTDGDITNDPTVNAITQKPELTLIKTANKLSLVVGETVTYTFLVKNTGNVTISDVKIDDTGLTGLSEVTTTDNTTLLPEAIATFTATYVVKQSDVDKGKLENSATVKGKDVNGEVVEDISDVSDNNTPGADENGDGDTGNDPTVITNTKTPKLELDKSSVVEEEPEVGDKITYTFVVRNIGNVTITDISIEDKLEGLSLITPASVATLAPGKEANLTATYTLTQTDIDNGVVENTAIVTGKDPDGKDIKDVSDSLNPNDTGENDNNDGNDKVDDDPTRTVLKQSPELTLNKVADKSTLVVGETVTYKFTVQNTGNVTMTDVKVTDPLEGLSDVTPVGVASLVPGNSVIFTATYVVTQADVDNGKLENSATTTGKDPKGVEKSDVSDNNTPNNDEDGDAQNENDPTVIKTEYNPELTLNKTADKLTLVVGETITYTFTVENTGNVTIKDVLVEDKSLEGLSTITPVDKVTLTPGETGTYTATYDVKQSDVDSGEVKNTATVTGTDPKGNPVVDTSDNGTPGADADNDGESGNDPTVVTNTKTPKLELDKSSVVSENSKVGTEVNYTFVVRNIGNVTITDISIDDKLEGLSAVTPASVETLAPGKYVSYTATYTLTQSDIDNGLVKNTAKVIGKDPDGKVVTDVSDSLNPNDSGDNDNNDGNDKVDDDPTRTVLTQTPVLMLVKTSTISSEVKLGDNITYEFVVTNTGNVTVTNLVIGDDKISNIVLDKTTLLPGEKSKGTAYYKLTQSDFDTGRVENTATVTGKDPKGKDVTDVSDSGNDTDNDGNNNTIDPKGNDGDDTNDPTVTIVPNKGELVLIKSSGSLTEEVKVGDVITYIFEVENTGTVILKDLRLTDYNIEGTITLGKTTLLPGEKSIVTADYKLTQSDFDAGKVENTATVTGKDPKGKDVTDVSDSGNEGDDDGSGNTTDPKGNDGDNTNDPTVTLIPEKVSLILAVYDSLPSIGGSVLGNDTLNGNPVTTDNTDVTPKEEGPLNIDIDGNVTVDIGTPSGIYSIEYTICETGINAGNCTTAIATVVIPSDIIVKNSFSPNGDGHNETLWIDNIDNTVNTVEIFNRWGNTVFKTDNYNNYSNSWSGKSEGKSRVRAVVLADDLVPTGTYFYVITVRLNGKDVTKKGWIYISTK